jgi:hypothetical protein
LLEPHSAQLQVILSLRFLPFFSESAFILYILGIEQYFIVLARHPVAGLGCFSFLAVDFCEYSEVLGFQPVESLFQPRCPVNKLVALVVNGVPRSQPKPIYPGFKRHHSPHVAHQFGVVLQITRYFQGFGAVVEIALFEEPVVNSGQFRKVSALEAKLHYCKFYRGAYRLGFWRLVIFSFAPLSGKPFQ